MHTAIIRRVLRVNWWNLALGHSVLETASATFVRNTRLPGIYDANFIFNVTATTRNEIEALMVRAAQEYSYAARLTFRIDPFTPPLFEAELVAREYTRSEGLLLLLAGDLLHEPKPCDTRPVVSDAEWRSYYELKNLDWCEHGHTLGVQDDVDVALGLATSNRLKCPPVQYVLAYHDGEPIGFCSAWEGLDGIGQVEDLFVHPAHRGQGIATALLHCCVVLARDRGAGPIVLIVDTANTAKKMYTALGWQPVAVCREYGKPIR